MANIHLTQGNYLIGQKEDIITTILGSCVSVVLWHPDKKIGAISHSLLDKRMGSELSSLDSKFCDEAIKLMINDLTSYNVDIYTCQASIFGGASLNPNLINSRIGLKNGKTALAELRRLHIPIVFYDLFGYTHRKIIFNVNSGKIICDK